MFGFSIARIIFLAFVIGSLALCKTIKHAQIPRLTDVRGFAASDLHRAALQVWHRFSDEATASQDDGRSE